MIVYSLPQDPNFYISISPEGNVYDLHFQYIRGLMYVTIRTDGGDIIAGPHRVCNGQWLISEVARNYEGGGNIMVVAKGDEYPSFEMFNECEMRYYTRDEIDNE